MFLSVTEFDIENLLYLLQKAYAWLFDVFRQFWYTIQSNVLLMTATMLFLILSAVFLVGWLIITIAPASFGKPYVQSFFAKYPNPNNVYFTKIKFFPFLQKKKSVYDTNLATNKAFDSMNKQYYYDKQRASRYFSKHPNVNSIIINGRRFTRRGD